MNVRALLRGIFGRSSSPSGEKPPCDPPAGAGCSALKGTVRAAWMMLAGVGLALVLAACVSAFADRRQTLADASERTILLADHMAAEISQEVGQDMAGLADRLAQWPPAANDAPDAAEDRLRVALAAIPQARFLAVQDGQGRHVHAVSSREGSPPLHSPPSGHSPGSAEPREGMWSVAGREILVISRNLPPPGGGRIVLGVAPHWHMHQFGRAGAAPPVQALLLVPQGVIAAHLSTSAHALPADLGGRLVLPSPSAPSSPTAAGHGPLEGRWQIERRTILPGNIDLVIALDREAALAGWRARTSRMAAWMALPLLLLVALGLAAPPLLRRRIAPAPCPPVASSSPPPLHDRSRELRIVALEDGFLAGLREHDAETELQEKLSQAHRMETIGQLAGGIAHDVNNLLTVILGNLELLLLRAEDRQRGQPDPSPDLDSTLAEAALRAGESASQLMHRLVGFSRRQKPQAQALHLEALLKGLQPLLRRALSEQIGLRLHWPADLWRISAPSSDLESALLNLALNAQDAMPGGGRLTIQAANVAVDRIYAAVAGLQRTGDFVMLCVADTGTGMAKDVLDHAADPFFTTKAPDKGSGLGLAMVYAFAQQNGGHVLIDSEPGTGTAVRLYLPRAALPTVAADRPPPASPETDLEPGHENLLLVEDNDQVRSHAEDLLARLGYHMRSAANGPAALAILAEGFRPDLLITDVILPGGITGRDVAEQAQSRLPGLRVLFTSGYPGGVLIENGRLPPGVDLLAKPFRRSELAARVRAHLDAAGKEESSFS